MEDRVERQGPKEHRPSAKSRQVEFRELFVKHLRAIRSKIWAADPAAYQGCYGPGGRKRVRELARKEARLEMEQNRYRRAHEPSGFEPLPVEIAG